MSTTQTNGTAQERLSEEKNHAKSNAKAWVGSLVEMVARCNEEEAAKLYVSELSEEQVNDLLTEAGCLQEGVTYLLSDLQELLRDEIETGGVKPDDLPGFEFDEDEAREEIQDSPLSVQVRSGWVGCGEAMEASEFEILLTTGGPALRIRGELNEYKEPDRAWLEYQDWGTPWTQYFDVEQETLLAYCRCFYFGE